jgi:NAD(P)H-hydrate epimerase
MRPRARRCRRHAIRDAFRQRRSHGEAIRADYTVTFTAPKISQIFPPNCERVGELTVAPIGTARSVLESNPKLKLSLLEAADFAALVGPRKRSSHKGDFGHVLVVGGSRSKAGAVIMSGAAALRAGAGLVTVATAAGAVKAVISHTPELMTIPVEEIPDGSMSERAFTAGWFDRKTVVAIGPGVGTVPENAKLVLRVAEEAWKTKLPLVVDADALTALASAGPKKWKRPASVTVLTPHPGEMVRLTGLPVKEVLQRRIEVAREFAEKRGVYVVLKGFRTLVASPDGHVLVNPTGTPAMAKGGSGDILTGMIAGFLAQFPQADASLVIAAAVYLHGLAAQMAAKSAQTLLATDILGALPEAILSLQK